MMSDISLRQYVLDELEFEPSVNAAHIGVAAEKGVVTLTGHVGSYAEKITAERVVQRVLEIQERSLGRHRVVVQTLMTLAGLYEEEGKNAEANYSQALSFYQRALAIQEVNLGPSHPEVFYLLSKCADLLLKLHDDAKAAEVRARMALITHENEQK